jgi:hypothetical protein
MAFDLSAAFDTVAAEQLSPTLQGLGVTGRELRWFLCYMTGGRQCVVWDCTVSTLINVLYGVRPGSILGPLVFIILVSGMAKFLGVEEGENVVYEDDSNVWQTGNNVEEVVRRLTEKAALFVDYIRSMGLSMNATKTQLLLSAKAGNVSEVTVEVDGNTILPCKLIELLGVRYDRKLTTTPHVRSFLAAETWSCYHSNDGQDGARNHVGSILFTENKTATAKTTRSARTGQITVPLRRETPLSRMQPTCGTGCPSLAACLRRRLQRRRHQIWQVSHHLSQDPAGLDPPPAAHGVFPAGRGVSPQEHCRIHQEVGRFNFFPSRLPLLLLSGSSCLFLATAAARNKQDSARLCLFYIGKE